MILRCNFIFSIIKIIKKTKEELEGQPLSVVYSPQKSEYIQKKHIDKFKSGTVKTAFEKELSADLDSFIYYVFDLDLWLSSTTSDLWLSSNTDTCLWLVSKIR